jgi:hypothetical protein
MRQILTPGFPALVIVYLLPLAALAAVSDDQHWDNQFGPAGVNGPAYGIAVIGNNIYTAGSFTAAGNTKANSVGGFDGTNWFQLNSGLLGLNPLAVCAVSDNNYLYVGGIFTNADDPTAIDTARWDGTNWAGIGIQGLIETVKRNGSNVYFAGVFSGTTNVTSTNIIGWNGTNWFALGQGLGGSGFYPVGSVNCLAFQGNNIYAGGNFSYSGTSSMTNIAYWDGSAWHAMGNPFNGTVSALTFYDGYLYAGGGFTNTSLGLVNIARWNGSAWAAVSSGGANNLVYDFATDGINLYVGGNFTQIGGITATGIVSFNGSTWTNVGGGIYGFQGVGGQVKKMLWQSNQLYIAGSFERAGNTGADNVARWDGTQWWSIGGQTSHGVAYGVNFVQSLLAVSGPSSIPSGVYAGGLSTEAGDVVVNCIGRWDGTNWNSVGSGVSGSLSGNDGQRVYALATDGTYLYAAGFFTNAGGSYASGVAYWNGGNWYPLGSGVDWIANAVAVGDADYIWVGGSFTNAGGIYSRGLAVWADGSWYNLGNVEGTNAIVYALEYDGGTKVYVGGQFYSAGGVAATNIACFDDTDSSWHALGPGLSSGRVASLAYTNGVLYAGGTFTNAGSLAVQRIAQWNGTSWSSLGNGITGNGAASVNGIVVSGTNVYVTGNFTNAGSIAATNIARWNGTSWSALGSGLDPTHLGSAITAVGKDIYAGGSFSLAGDKPSQFIGHWNDQSNYYPAANMQLTRLNWLTNRQFHFRLTGTSGQSYILQATTNFITWTPLQTNSATFYDFTDTNAVNFSYRFYQAVLGP